jgi:hypothetical protein
MRGGIPPLLQYVFMAWRLVKHRDNFTFTFYYNVSVSFTLIRFKAVFVNWTCLSQEEEEEDYHKWMLVYRSHKKRVLSYAIIAQIQKCHSCNSY